MSNFDPGRASGEYRIEASRIAVLSALLAFSAVARAETISGRVQDVWPTPQNSSIHRVTLKEDNRVFLLTPGQGPTAASMRSFKDTGTPIQVSTEGDRITQAQPLDTNERAAFQALLPETALPDSFRENHNDSFEPTVLDDELEARSFFNTFTIDFKSKAQCYQRAHVWVWSLWNGYTARTLKVFLFFTRRYIDEYEYKWWFHVSPVVLVGSTPMVLDRFFTNGPTPMRAWTNLFMKNSAECPEVSLYSDYENHQSEQYCYRRIVPMYYYQPIDVRTHDLEGLLLTDFRDWDIQNAQKGLKSD
jgi:hypothetical protein